MRKVTIALMVLLIVAFSASASFAWDNSLYVPQMGYDSFSMVDKFCSVNPFKSPFPSEKFMEIAKRLFEEPEDCIVENADGEDITEKFISENSKAFAEGNYLLVWRNAQDEVRSISIAKDLRREVKQHAVAASKFPVRGANITVNAEGTKYFLEKNPVLGAGSRLCEFIIVVKGTIVENTSTGKILAAANSGISVSSTAHLGKGWRVCVLFSGTEPIKANYSVLFIGGVRYYVSTGLFDAYESEIHNMQFRFYSI